MQKTLLTILFLTLAPVLLSCSKPDITQYADSRPTFDLYDYFAGYTRGWGMVQDRNGNVLRRFVVDINGSVSEDRKLVLDEAFEWSDGELSNRIWTIEQLTKHTYLGTAPDVIGEAQGSAYGNTLNWKYYLSIESNGRNWKVYLDDWMYLQQDNVLINKTKMSKFGFGLGEITIVFTKPEK